MKYPTETDLGTVADVVSGYAFPSTLFCDNGIPVVKIGNIGNGDVSFETSSTQYISEADAERVAKQFYISRGDVLISLTGSHITQPNSVVGRVGLYRYPFPSLLNQRAAKVVAKAGKCDQRFLFYLLSTKSFREEIALRAHGAANQANVSPTDIRRLKIIHLPPLETQRKIAGILSAYDDLIENNRRRIAILERMAEELYREWFVRMRFPGYQNTKFIKGVPEGWEECGLASLGDYLNGFAFKPLHWGLEGIPIIKIREMTSGITRETPRNSGEGIQPRYEVNDGDIIFSWSATLLVQIWNQGRGLLNQHLFKVTPKSGVPRSFLFLALKAALPIFDSLTTGATMKHIKRKELEVAKVIKPTKNLLQNFDRHVEPMLCAVMKLSKSLLSLVEQRDSLLGGLVSRKISVEHLPVLLPANMSDVPNNKEELAHA